MDGNDAEAVANVSMEIVDRLRAGGGPEFLHAKTYRRVGHTSFDPATYRPENEAQREGDRNDPILRHRAVLRAAGMSEDEILAMHTAAREEMIEVLQQAANTPFPDDRTAFDDVQDIGSPALEAY